MLITEYLGRAYRLLISRRFAVSLLIAISVLLFLGILLPNLSYHEPEEMTKFERDHPILFTFGRIFNPPTLTTSWTFLILTGLLMLSTFLCCIERLRNREFQDPYGAQPKFFRQRKTLVVGAPAQDVFKASLRVLRRGWWRPGPQRQQQEYVFLEGRKGAPGFWGSIIFHLGFLVILAGVVASSLTRFSGTVLVTEGQQVALLMRNLTETYKKPMLDYELPGSRIFLGKFKADIRDERFPVNYLATVSLTEPDGPWTIKRIGVNQGIRYGQLSILLQNYGFAPSFVIKDKKGKSILDAYINLKGREAGNKDSFKVPGKALAVETVFFPNFKLTSSIVPKAPAFLITVKEDGRQIFKGYLHKGKSVKFKGMTMRFPDMRYWAYFIINRDLGLIVVFWGFVISFIGLVIRFIWHDRQLSIRIKPVEGGTELLVSGRSKYFPAFFKEELARLADRIDGISKSGGDSGWTRLKQYSSG